MGQIESGFQTCAHGLVRTGRQIQDSALWADILWYYECWCKGEACDVLILKNDDGGGGAGCCELSV